jgi:hypothetical protein
MYRRVLVLLLAAVFFLGGCTVLWNTLKKTEAQKMEIRETEIIEQSPDMSGEESMYMDTTENIIYLAGGCFWGSVFQNQDFFNFGERSMRRNRRFYPSVGSSSNRENSSSVSSFTRSGRSSYPHIFCVSPFR